MKSRKRRIVFVTFGIAAMAGVIVASIHGDWRRYSLSAENAFFDGDYLSAEKQFLSATARAEAFGPQDPRLASALTDLASFYYFVGRYRLAEGLIKRAITIEQSSYGATDPQIAASMFDLVNIYAADSRLNEARSVAERALAIQAKAVGNDHRSLADGLDIYAGVLEKAGRFEEAAAARRRATELLAQTPAPSSLLR